MSCISSELFTIILDLIGIIKRKGVTSSGARIFIIFTRIILAVILHLCGFLVVIQLVIYNKEMNTNFIHLG